MYIKLKLECTDMWMLEDILKYAGEDAGVKAFNELVKRGVDVEELVENAFEEGAVLDLDEVTGVLKGALEEEGC